MTTQQELIVEQTLGEYYHAAVGKSGKHEAVVARFKRHISGLQGIRPVAERERDRLESFAKKCGDLNKRCVISAHRLTCLRQALNE